MPNKNNSLKITQVIDVIIKAAIRWKTCVLLLKKIKHTGIGTKCYVKPSTYEEAKIIWQSLKTDYIYQYTESISM